MGFDKFGGTFQRLLEFRIELVALSQGAKEKIRLSSVMAVTGKQSRSNSPPQSDCGATGLSRH